ncbi:hypothetical protein FOQG_17616 [Fusarium oxysporum f. sp. raphani 54005]|uniref:NACHT domain-containing protein n=1 Tax=Fusarium oxysporum f. sp. raphani 54005 TaxID=1089458 RepID=X0B6F1_FUSOX|nr:hypothetical protein FOQG_17616 [Fusarium oxysporum f. sp. raphani 54005]
MWLQRLKVDSQKSSDAVRVMDICPLCCLPLAELTKLKASIPQASESETSAPKARTPSGNKRASKTVRFDVSEPETLVTADTETPTRAERAMMLDHIADHLQFLALLTPRLSTEKLGEGGIHTFSSYQGLSSDQGSGKRSTLDDDFASAEGDETQDADMDTSLDGAPQIEATTDQAWQEDEEIESGEAMDWSIVATLNPPNEGDDKIEHMQRVRAECDNLLEAALESFVEGRHYRRLFLETAAASCKSITTKMLMALEREVAVGALIDFFAREIPRDALRGFFKKALTSVDSGKSFMLVDYCTEQVWDFRPYQDSHVPTKERFASRRVLFGLLAMLDRPLDILRAIKDGISDVSIPLATTTLTQLFPTWTGTEVSSFMRFQREVHALVLDGPDFRHFMDSSQPDQKHQDDRDKKCLQDLFETDPRDDKARIEATKGGLLRDSYRWILDNDGFRRWRDNPQIPLLWIKGGPGKGKTMLLCGIIDELGKEPDNRLSYFFCQATDARLSNATAVLRGLIYLLVVQQPSLISHVREKHDYAGKQLFEDRNAWDALSKILAAMLNDPSLDGAILIVDALDECKTNRHQLLDLIARPSRVKWIVSSRNWQDIDEKLDNTEHKVRLHLELNKDSISEAVDTYIGYKVNWLAGLKKYDKETRDAVQRHLVGNANGTFLWVALVCQALAGPKVRKRHTLNMLKLFPPGLDPFYDRMIWHIDDSGNADLCKEVLAIASVVYRPITLDELKVLIESLGDLHQDDLEEIIGSCGSFLTIREGVVDFVHQSAKEYLLNKASGHILSCGIAHQHHALFSRSLAALLETLRCDIYSLSTPGFSIDRVSPPDPNPLSSIRYSCVYWVHHLHDSDSTEVNNILQGNGDVHKFMRKKYLYWLESLSLLRSMSEGVNAVRKLETLVKNAGGRQLAELLRDARRFILSHKRPIEIAPLQVYASALVFSPESSHIRELFKKEEPDWIVLKPRMEADWNACLQTLEGHGEAVNSVAFSADDLGCGNGRVYADA